MPMPTDLAAGLARLKGRIDDARITDRQARSLASAQLACLIAAAARAESAPNPLPHLQSSPTGDGFYPSPARAAAFGEWIRGLPDTSRTAPAFAPAASSRGR